jgi:hypothetical protein
MYAVLLEDYMRPNNLEFDKEFMTRGIVSLMINAYGMFCVLLVNLIEKVISTLCRRS